MGRRNYRGMVHRGVGVRMPGRICGRPATLMERHFLAAKPAASPQALRQPLVVVRMPASGFGAVGVTFLCSLGLLHQEHAEDFGKLPKSASRT